MVTYRIDPERSGVSIDARSSVHPVHSEATGLEGYVEAETTDGHIDGATPATMRFELAVDQLKSGNPLYDQEMQRRVDSRRFPMILGEAREVRLVDGRDGRYHLHGDLTVHGVKRPVEGEVRISISDERTIIVEGEHEFDVRDFGMTPPKILMLQVYPQVMVRLQLVAQRDAQT